MNDQTDDRMAKVAAHDVTSVPADEAQAGT